MTKEDKAEWDRKAALLFTDAAAAGSGVISGATAPDVACAIIFSRRLQTDNLGPKKYEDRRTIETSTTVKVEHTRKLDISTLSDEQLDALEKALRATVT